MATKFPIGNSLCIFVCILESFLFNGIFQGFGMMTNVLKEDGLYGEYCENSTDNTDSLQNLTSSISCAERDRLLGNINVASN